MEIGATYTISADSTAAAGFKKVYLGSGTAVYFGSSFILTEEMANTYVFFASGYSDAGVQTISNLQIEKGSAATAYTPYIADMNTVQVTRKRADGTDSQTYAPESDGTVAGMRSVAPSMTILTDNAGAIIKAIYNANTKGYIDKKINEAVAPLLSAQSGI